MNNDLITKVTPDDFVDAIYDEYGLYYSKDYKRLLSYRNPTSAQENKIRIAKIVVNPKTEVICENAFEHISFSIGFFPKKTEIIMPDGLKVIGDNAFAFSTIEKITIPATTEQIFGNPFHDSDISEIKNKSKHFKLKDGILYDKSYERLIHCFDQKETFVADERTKFINKSAFANQSKLKLVILPNVIEIDDKAFYTCPKIEFISLSTSLLSIGEKAFKQPIVDNKHFDDEYFCETRRKHFIKNNITIKIPTSVKFIGNEALGGISKIESSSPNFIIRDGLLLSSDGSKLYNCLSVNSVVVIPIGVEEILDSAFEGNETIERLIVTEQVQRIGKKAFQYCYNLKSVFFEGNNVELGEFVFSDCINLENVSLPQEISDIPNFAFCNCPQIESIIFPNTISRIGDSAFSDCSFRKLIMPNELRIIENNAFDSCRKLLKLTLNDKLEKIGSFAFGDSEINELTIPFSVQTIGAYAFNVTGKVFITNPETIIYDNGLGSNWWDSIIQYPTRYVVDMKCYKEISKFHHLVPMHKERTLENRLSGEDMG